MTFGFEAAEKLRRIEELVIEIAACELVTARQAWALRGLPAPPGLAAMAALVEAVVPPVNEDRPLGGDIEAATRLLQGNEL
jgi:histidine ammonia-lyase